MDTTGPCPWLGSTVPVRTIRSSSSSQSPSAKDGAERTTNYTIDENIKVLRAALGTDLKSVTLAISPLAEDVALFAPRSVTFKTVRPKPNLTDSKARTTFRHEHSGNGFVGGILRGPRIFRERRSASGSIRTSTSTGERNLPLETMKPDVPYSVRWTGPAQGGPQRRVSPVLLPRMGATIATRARVWIDGKLLANESYGSVTLKAGKTYELKVELKIVRPTKHADFYSLRWSSLSVPKQTIPQSHLGDGPSRKTERLSPSHQGHD